MQKEEIILFKGRDGIARWGKVTHYENWYEEWKKGNDTKIFDVLLDDKEYYLQDGDILFIDEIHRLNRNIEEVLYPAMEDFTLDLVNGTGAMARWGYQ